MVIFSETATETLTTKSPKTLKLTLECGMSMKFFNNIGVLYMVEKVSKSAIQWYCFREQ